MIYYLIYKGVKYIRGFIKVNFIPFPRVKTRQFEAVGSLPIQGSSIQYSTQDLKESDLSDKDYLLNCTDLESRTRDGPNLRLKENNK